MVNKYQEALERLRILERAKNLHYQNQVAPQVDCDVLQELVDKATPKKPDVNINNGYCPNCHQTFGLERTKEAMIRSRWFSFCPYCGQALDWSEE
jgi:hypothetical protein|nr:MAG TPA: putative hydrogenase nickel incorporation protein [Caudoviricetes sp.]